MLTVATSAWAMPTSFKSTIYTNITETESMGVSKKSNKS